MGSIGGRAEPGGGAPLGDWGWRKTGRTPPPPRFFLFGADRTLVPSGDHGGGGSVGSVAAEGGSVAVVARSVAGAMGALRGDARAAGGGCQPRRPWGLSCPLFPPLRQRRRPWRGGGSKRVCCHLWWRGGWAAGCGWQPGRPGGLGRSPPTPCSSSTVALASVAAGDKLRQRRICQRQRERAWSATSRWVVEHCCSCRARVWWRRRSSWQMLVG
jgi:hypothetical protein